MAQIRIIMPPQDPHFIGSFVLLNMETGEALMRVLPGETAVLPAGAAMDIGIACVRVGYPAVRQRFTAVPGWTYRLFWRTAGFGADMGVAILPPEP